MKPRADAKLKSLPQEEQDELCTWLAIENVTYQEARKRVFEKFEVTTSVAALSDFYSSVAVPWKYARAHGVASELSAQMKGDASFDSVSMKRLQQILFEMTISNEVDVKAIKTLAKIVGDSHKLAQAGQRLELDKRKVKLLEAKAAQADKGKAVAADENLSAEEQLSRFRQIFGGK